MKKPILNKSGEARAFFGRRSGKHLGISQKKLFEEILPLVEIKLDKKEEAISPLSFFADFKPKKTILEIGYGGGEHLARKALENPDIAYIGCEVFSGGVGKMLEKIKTHNIKNIRLFNDDALNLLNMLKPNNIDEIYLLYPDPWPKMRHHKRRFVSNFTLEKMGRVLKENGKFHFASDIEDYANWTLAHILRHKNFTWTIQKPLSWHIPFKGWQATRYEKKAKKEGRTTSFYFSFDRV